MKSPVYRCSTIYAALLGIAYIVSPGCTLDTWGDLRGDGGSLEDVRPEQEGDASGDTVSERSDTTTGDPITLDPAGDEPASDMIDREPLPDPDLVPDPEPEPEHFCGDGHVDPGEECDNDSELCNECRLVPPDGWERCMDSYGNIFFWFIKDWSGTHQWHEMRNRCVNLIEDHEPEDFAWYGLAVFADRAVWDCVIPHLNTSNQYYIGLRQRGDAGEPTDGWNWKGYNGDSWFDVAPFDLDNDFMIYVIDNGCGEGEPDCGRLAHDTEISAWSFWDYGCDSSEDWDGICMVQF